MEDATVSVHFVTPVEPIWVVISDMYGCDWKHWSSEALESFIENPTADMDAPLRVHALVVQTDENMGQYGPHGVVTVEGLARMGYAPDGENLVIGRGGSPEAATEDAVMFVREIVPGAKRLLSKRVQGGGK